MRCDGINAAAWTSATRTHRRAATVPSTGAQHRCAVQHYRCAAAQTSDASILTSSGGHVCYTPEPALVWFRQLGGSGVPVTSPSADPHGELLTSLCSGDQLHSVQGSSGAPSAACPVIDLTTMATAHTPNPTTTPPVPAVQPSTTSEPAKQKRVYHRAQQPADRTRRNPYVAGITLQTQQSIASIQAATTLTALAQTCHEIATSHPAASRQPGLILAAAARMEALLRAHMEHMDDLKVMLRFSGGVGAAPNHTTSASAERACLSAGKAAVQRISQCLSSWVQLGATGRQAQVHQSAFFKPHQAVTVLHALARAVRAAGSSCVLAPTVFTLSTMVTSATVCSDVRQSESAGGRQGLVPAQLVTAAWSLAVLGSHDAQLKDSAWQQQVLQWVYTQSEPVLSGLSSRQVTRLMWAAATLTVTSPRSDQSLTAYHRHPKLPIAHSLVDLRQSAPHPPPPPSWWAQLEAAMLSQVTATSAAQPSQPGPTVQGPYPCAMSSYDSAALALCCWAGSQLSIPQPLSTSPAQQPQGHLHSSALYPSPAWVHTLLSCLRTAHQGADQHRNTAKGHTRLASVKGHGFLHPAKLAALVSGLTRLGYSLPHPLLDTLVSAALVAAQPTQSQPHMTAGGQHSGRPLAGHAMQSGTVQQQGAAWCPRPHTVAQSQDAVHDPLVVGMVSGQGQPVSPPSQPAQRKQWCISTRPARRSQRVLPLSQLLQLLHCQNIAQAPLSSYNLGLCATSFQEALPQCTGRQLVVVAVQLIRLGLRQPSRAFISDWLCAVGRQHWALSDPRLQLIVLKVLVTWRVWPGAEWLLGLLSRNRVAVRQRGGAALLRHLAAQQGLSVAVRSQLGRLLHCLESARRSRSSGRIQWRVRRRTHRRREGSAGRQT